MQMRRAVISVLTAALFCVPAQAATDITKLGPPGFALAGFGAMPGGYLVGSVRDFKAPYVSRNRGSTWVKASRPHPTAPVLAFLGSRTSPGTTWMGTSFGGVYVSHDGGRTSAVAGQLRTFTPIFQLGRRGALFVALTGKGIARSRTLKNWTTTPLPGDQWFAAVSEDGVVLEYGPTGAARQSVNGGGTFVSTSLPGFDVTCPVGAIGTSAPPLARVYVTDRCGRIWRSNDGGVSYVRLGDAPAAPSSIAVDSVSADQVYAATATGALRSVDGGATWKPLKAAPPDAALVADPELPAVLYGRTEWRLYRSRDAGATWAPVGPNITGRDFVKSVARSTSAVLAGTRDGLRLLRDGEAAWRPASGLPAGSPVRVIRVDPHRPAVALAVSDAFGLYRSDDAGATWHPPSQPGGGVSDVAFDPNAAGSIWLVTSLGLMHTTNDGASWDLVPGTALVSHVAVVMGAPNVLILVRGDGIYRSPDGGLTQQRVVAPQPAATGATFPGWAVSDPYQTGRVLAQTGLRTAGSDDGGATWHAIGVVFSARVPPVFAADGTIFAAGAAGEVLASIDVGATWTPTPDPAERGGLLRASDGIAAVPAEPTVPAAPRSVPTIYAARTAVYRVRFRGVIPRLALPSGAVLRSDRRSVRVRVICRERPVRYCGGRIVVRQHGREVGRTLFAVAPARTRRALIVTVPLEHAVRGAARLELSGSSPWASRVEVRRRLRLR